MRSGKVKGGMLTKVRENRGAPQKAKNNEPKFFRGIFQWVLPVLIIPKS